MYTTSTTGYPNYKSRLERRPFSELELGLRGSEISLLSATWYTGFHTHVAHLLELPNLGGRSVLGPDVVFVAGCSSDEEARRVMVVRSMRISEERVPHQPHSCTSQSRSLRNSRVSSGATG